MTTDATDVPDPLLPLVQRVSDLYAEQRLDEALALMREVVRRRLPNRSELDSANLAFLLQQSFDTARDPGILHEAIEHANFGLAAFDGDDLRLRLAQLRLSWRLLHATARDPAALQDLTYVPGLLADTDDPDCLDHHRQILEDLHRLTGSTEVLADLVTVCRAVCERPRDDPLLRYHDASLLALSLRDLHDATGDPAARDEAIAVLAAVSETVPDPRLRAMHMGELALLLDSRSIDVGDPAETKQAIEVLRRALSLAAPSDRGRCHYNLGNLLFGLARRTGAYSPLPEAIGAYRAGLLAVRPAQRLACVANLASALMDSGLRTAAQAEVDEAVTLVRIELLGPYDAFAEEVLWSTMMRSLESPGVTVDHCLSLATLARQALAHPGTGDLPALRQDRICQILTKAGRLTGEQRHLDDAVAAGRKALDLLPPGHKRSYLEANLALALCATGNKRGDQAALSEAVDLMRRALSRTGPDDPDRPKMRNDLAGTLLSLNTLEHDSGRLTEAISHAQAAVDAVGTGVQADRLLTLASLLHQRAEYDGDRQAAALALDRYRQALALPLGRIPRAALLTNYAALLFHVADSHGATTVAADLYAGIYAITEAVALIPDTLPDLLRIATSRLTILPTKLLDLDDTDAHIELALTAWRSALARAEAHRWDDLVIVLLEVTSHARIRRHYRHHEPDDLQQAIACLERALDLAGEGHPDSARPLTSLGIAYRIRFGVTEALADLDRAVKAGTSSVEATGADDPAFVHRLAHLSAHHRERYLETGAPDDLARAIDLATTAHARDPDDDTASAHLADALTERFRRRSNPEDLLQAIDLIRAVHEKAGPGGESDVEDTAVRLNNLASMLIMRYHLFAIPSDLSEGIEAFIASLELTPRTHYAYAKRLINTGQAFLERATLVQASAGRESERSPATDRAQAIAYLETAVGATRPGTYHHSMAVGALVAAHAVGEEQESAAFGGAVARGLAIARDDADDGLGWAHVAHNTAVALTSRWGRTGNGDDLDQAIDLFRACARRGGRYSALSAQQLGEWLAHRIKSNEQPGDRAEAAKVLYSVASDPTAPAQVRYRAVRVWFTVTDRQDSPRILDGCRLLLALLTLAAWPGAPREAQESWLAREGGIAAETARLALDADEPETAAEFLEQGRAVLWSRALNSRSDLAEVAEADPDLVARLLAVRDELERLAAWPEDGAADDPVPAPDRDLMAELLQAGELRHAGDRVGILTDLRELAKDQASVAAAETALGITLLEAGETADAELALRRAVATGVGHAAMAAVTLGDLLLNRGDVPGARAAYERSAAIGGDDDAPERLRIVALAEARQSKASRFADSLISSGDLNAMLDGLVDLYKDREYGEARLLAELLMSNVDERGQAMIGGVVGVVRAQAGDITGARAALEMSLDGPTAHETAIALGDLLLCEFTADEARAAYELAARTQMTATARSRLELLAPPDTAPGAQPPLYDYGRHIAHQTSTGEGIAAIRDAIATGDTRARTQFYLGELLPPAQKADAYRRALVLAGPGDDALVLLCRGWLRVARSDQPGGCAAFDAAWRKALDSADAELAALAAVNLAFIHKSGGDLRAARDAYQRAIQAGHPQHSPAAAFDCAQLLAEHGDTGGAANLYRSIMATGHPVQGNMAAINLGSILQKSGDLAGAREAYTHALNGFWPDATARARVALARIPSSVRKNTGFPGGTTAG